MNRARSLVGAVCRSLAPASLTIVLLGLAACNGSGSGGPYGIPDTIPPTVNSMVPANGANNVSVSTTVTVGFSEAVNCATVTASSFALAAGGAVTGNIACSGTGATFTPAAALAYGTVYTIAVTTAVTDNAGNALASAVSSSFTTAAAPDSTPPTVSSTSPTSGATGVALNATVSAVFSEAMDCNTLTDSTFTLSAGAAVTGNVTCAGDTATFAPSADLAPSTVYTATLTTGVTDLVGNPLATDYSWNFTTATAPAAGSRVIFSNNSFIFVISDDGTNGVTLAGDASNTLEGGYGGLTPNGHVIFQAGLATASVKLDGTGRVTLANGSPAGITPNSRVVISTADGTVSPANFDLQSVNADGTDLKTLANSASDNEMIVNATILGGSSGTQPYTNLTRGVTASGKVVYTRQPRAGGPRDVYVVNEDGTGGLALGATADDEGEPYNLPGGRIAYWRGPWLGTPYHTVLIGEDGSNPVSLASTQGGVMAFESGRVVTQGFLDQFTVGIHSLNPDGTDAATLVSGSIFGARPNFKAVSGGRVIFTQGPSFDEDLYSVPVDGSLAPVLIGPRAEGARGFQGLTSNGKAVYGVGDLYSVDLTGSNKTPLAASADWEEYRASTADGKVIYERLLGSANYDVYIVNADGTGTLPLADTADVERFAGLSPSGRVLYIRSVVGGMQLWSVRPDGTGAVMLGSGTNLRFHLAF